jgi:hypothetical protein
MPMTRPCQEVSDSLSSVKALIGTYLQQIKVHRLVSTLRYLQQCLTITVEFN